MAGTRARTPARDARFGARAGAARPRDDRRRRLRDVRARARRVRHRGDDVGARVPARPPRDRTTPGPAILAIHGHGPGKALHLRRHRRGARRGRALRARRSRRRATSCSRPTCAGSASAPIGCPTTSTTATGTSCAPRWPASCRIERNLWDLAAALDVLARASPRRPGAHRRGRASRTAATCTLFLAALDERVRVAVVSGYLSSWRAAHTVPWNMCGSQVMPGQLGALEHLDVAALVAPRPLLVESGDRRRDLPGRRPPARPWRRSGRCTRASAHPTTRSCTTSSQAATSLARHRRCRTSSRGGCEPHRRTSPRLAELGITLPGPVPAPRSARRGRRARRPRAHVGAASAQPRRQARAPGRARRRPVASSRAPRRRAGAR